MHSLLEWLLNVGGIKEDPIPNMISWKDSFNIIGRESQDLTRLSRESIYIRVNNPTLNRNIGKFQLKHIWDMVFFSTPKIKVAIPTGDAQHSP